MRTHAWAIRFRIKVITMYNDIMLILISVPRLFQFHVVKQVESDSESDDLAEAVDDLSRVVEGKPIKLRRKKKKQPQPEEKPRSPVFEQPIVAEEFIPLMDDTIAKTDGKGLLNVRVIFVIGG